MTQLYFCDSVRRLFSPNQRGNYFIHSDPYIITYLIDNITACCFYSSHKLKDPRRFRWSLMAKSRLYYCQKRGSQFTKVLLAVKKKGERLLWILITPGEMKHINTSCDHESNSQTLNLFFYASVCLHRAQTVFSGRFSCSLQGPGSTFKSVY